MNKIHAFTFIVGLGLATSFALATSLERKSDHPNSYNHLCNKRRTGYTPQAFKPPYFPAWTFTLGHKPRPAWREPAWEVQRIDMDYAFPMAADSKTVYVASSADHALHALDLDSGQSRWSFYTEGLRFAFG